MEKCQSCCSRMGTARQYERDRCEVERSRVDPALCVRCHSYRVNAWENVRRVEEWARRDGTRRPMAELLARQADQHEIREVSRAHHRRWIFLWEMTGERKLLRKVIESRVMPLYSGELAYANPDGEVAATTVLGQ